MINILHQYGQKKNARAEPLPVRNTRSIGHPQFRSTKSISLHSFAKTSAVGTSVAGLLPATCTPNIVSHGCRRTKDHSSLEPERKEAARPTSHSLSPQDGDGVTSAHFRHT